MSLVLTSPAFPSLDGVDPEVGFLPEGWLRGEGPFGTAIACGSDLGENPSLECLQKMMVVAEQGEIVELRRATFGKRNHVVDLDTRSSSTTRHDTTSVTSCQCDSKPAVDRSAQSGYRPNIAGSVEDEAKK